MRITTTAALLATLLPTAVQAADCKLWVADSIQMLHFSNDQRYIPVTINTTQENFLFDTGSYLTQISRSVAETLKLQVRPSIYHVIDAAGRISRDEATIHDFTLGHRHGADIVLPISTFDDFDGILALDQLVKLDTDVDFGTDKLNFFWPDHCPGQVVYWTSPLSVAIIPMIMEGTHMTVTVNLDGHEEKAIIDSGAEYTTLSMDEEKRVFGLTLGGSDTPEAGNLNGDTSLKTYRHLFTNLNFGDVAVSKPEVAIIPNAMGRNADTAQYVGDRTKSDKTEFKIPDMIIGMDILRKLHLYIAFGEKKLYISQVSTTLAAPVTQPAPIN
jgi:hypothetical protein